MPDVGRAPLQLTLPGFDGPVHELLRLAAERRVDLEEMRLAQVTSQVSRYLADIEESDLDEAGEVLAAAARLLALKSSRLLLEPAADEAEGVPRETKPGLIDLDALRERATVLRQREALESMPLPVAPVAFERRVAPRQPDTLTRMWIGMQQRARDAAGKVSMPAFLRLEVAISGLIRNLRASRRLSFRQITARANRNDAVVHFLAVLELCRRREAIAAQDALFGDITIESRESVTEVEAGTRAG